jgi:tetratricopeptide (TPR) repeat protein
MSDTNDNKQLERAESLIELARYKEAIPLLTKLLAVNPNDYHARCLLAVCFLSLSKFGDALEQLKKAIETEPENEWAFRVQSIVYTNIANNDDALSAAEEAVKLAPYSPFAFQALALAQLRFYKYDAAIKSANRMLEIAPSYPEAFETLGQIDLQRENFTEAEEYFRRALELNPNSYQSIVNLAHCLLKKAEQISFLKQFRKNKLIEEAMDYLSAAIRLNPTETSAKQNMAWAFEIANFAYLPVYPSLLYALFVIILIYTPVIVITFSEDAQAWFGQKPILLRLLNIYTLIGLLSVTIIFVRKIYKHSLLRKYSVFLNNINVNNIFQKSNEYSIYISAFAFAAFCISGFYLVKPDSDIFQNSNVFNKFSMVFSIIIFPMTLKYLYHFFVPRKTLS